MQFSSALLFAAACASAQAAQFTMGPEFFTNIKAGVPLNLTWSLSAAGPVTILLKNGPPSNLKTVEAAPTASSSGASTTYTIPATLPDGMYAFEIDEASVTNFSEMFATTGGAAAGSSSSSVTSSASLTTSTASSLSTVTALNSTATARPTANGTNNSTKTTSTTSRGTAQATAATSTPSNTNSGTELSSPLALVFLTLAAIMSLQ